MSGTVVAAKDATRVVVRAAAGPTVIAGILAIVVAAIVRGGPGALGAAIGAVVVVVFFAAGQIALGELLSRNPELAMPAALALYLVKIGILFVLIILLQGVTAFDAQVFGITILVCTVVWTVAETWALGKTKMLVVEPGTGPGVPPPAPPTTPTTGERP